MDESMVFVTQPTIIVIDFSRPSYIDADRHDDCRDAVPLQSPLNGESRFIMEYLLERVLLTEDQFSGKDRASREFLDKRLADFCRG
jgi:hypothetical protein